MNCLVCGKHSYNQYCFYHKPKKPIRSQGKHYIKWQQTRKEWFETNKASHYICYYCGVYLSPSVTTLDHKQSRSHAPHLRYSLSNLVPACFTCNNSKGSRSVE